MPTERRDYIVRLIEQLGIAFRNLRGQLGANPETSAEVADKSVHAQTELLGPLAATLPYLDAETAATLLGDPRRARLWADFIRLEADARRLEGEEDRAVALEARAAALDAAAKTMEG